MNASERARRLQVSTRLALNKTQKANTMTFTSGDIVRLKSGGPKMTVLGLDRNTPDNDTPDNDKAVFACKWFDRNGKLHTDAFAAPMIEAFIARSPEEIARSQTPKKPKTYDKPFEHKPFKG